MAFRRARLMMVVLLGAGLLAAHGLEAMPGLSLRSAAALVEDQGTGELLLQKHPDQAVPIASITKLMTAMVMIDAQQDMQEPVTILEEDKDILRHSRSRLPVGTTLTRNDTLLVALMASENRAAHALGRTYPGGVAAYFDDPTGLSSGNVASAKDLARIVDQAHHYPLIRTCTTQEETTIQGRFHPIAFHNTNRLLQSSRWRIGLSKTGFIDQSGECLVMQAELKQRPVLIVLLDSTGRGARFGDADRIRQWMEGADPVVRVARVAKVRRASKLVRVAKITRVARLARLRKPHRHPQA